MNKDEISDDPLTTDEATLKISSLRAEALKIATDMALKIAHFEHNYSTHPDPLEALLKDVDIVHKIAAHNLKYIMGEKGDI